MTQLFLPPEELSSKQVRIKDEKARYLYSVLRLKRGELLGIFDGQGHKYIAEVSSAGKKEFIVELLRRDLHATESPVSLVLAQGLPKADKMDFIVQKTTELGIKTIIPLVTERSQVRYTGKIERWRKIAIAASQQSGRERIPEIHEPITIEDFLNLQNKPEIRVSGILLWEEETQNRIKDILHSFKGRKEILMLIGPEGGFSQKEANMAIESGFLSATLGPRILRAETAAIAVISIIQCEMGDMG
ncbi:MAG: 16S rRNA (uracil(1498)-N(3))-methyltransferase [Nitrospirae bacterium]|nr:16S rRNA (uracil(1498)-N(3))-methyltransferase [Nitrospirota bacterium]